MGFEIGHLIRRGWPVHRKVVPHGGSGVHFRKRAARFSDGFVRQPRVNAVPGRDMPGDVTSPAGILGGRCRMRDGKISGGREYIDRATALEAAGLRE